MKKVQQDWESWRNRIRARLPELAHLVFALRARLYSGCGFHYDMERRLGGVMAQVNDFVNRRELADWICLKVSVEMLFKSIALAERSAAKLERLRKGENDDGNRDKDQEANPGHAGV